jgi:hypothetical protein
MDADFIGIGNIGTGNTSTLATFFKCCHCANVAISQFQFPMRELPFTTGIGNIGTGNTSTLATFVKDPATQSRCRLTLRPLSSACKIREDRQR